MKEKRSFPKQTDIDPTHPLSKGYFALQGRRLQRKITVRLGNDVAHMACAMAPHGIRAPRYRALE